MIQKDADAFGFPQIGVCENPQIGGHRWNLPAHPDQPPFILAEITRQYRQTQPGLDRRQHPVNRVHADPTPIGKTFLLEPTIESRICHALVWTDPVDRVHRLISATFRRKLPRHIGCLCNRSDLPADKGLVRLPRRPHGDVGLSSGEAEDIVRNHQLTYPNFLLKPVQSPSGESESRPRLVGPGEQPRRRELHEFAQTLDRDVLVGLVPPGAVGGAEDDDWQLQRIAVEQVEGRR